MSEIDNQRVKAGISVYSKSFLLVYDWVALGFNLRFLWKCPSGNLLNLYNKCVSGNHLDIGVGTGYFMERCKFPSLNPRIALMDLNKNALEMARKRLAKYDPQVYIGDALEKFNMNNRRYDSIGMMNLLHCLPGDMKTKGIVFDNADEVLNTGGSIFGSTILSKGVKHNLLATMNLKVCNQKGIMTNLDDDIEVLRNNLKEKFSDSSVETIGSIALFWAKK
ncbi:class I SAM-dependent methyltransferase [Chloroflexota bacterium]